MTHKILINSKLNNFKKLAQKNMIPLYYSSNFTSGIIFSLCFLFWKTIQWKYDFVVFWILKHNEIIFLVLFKKKHTTKMWFCSVIGSKTQQSRIFIVHKKWNKIKVFEFWRVREENKDEVGRRRKGKGWGVWAEKT